MRRARRRMAAYARYKRTMPRYRRRAAQGLASTKVLTVCKDPVFSWAYAANATASYTVRFSPFFGFGYGTTQTSADRWYMSLGQADRRFVALSAMYREFRVVNYTVSLKLQTNPYADNYGYVSFVGRVIRNANYGTEHTAFYDGTAAMTTPGIVWKRNNTATNKLPGITLSVYPKAVTERQQWYPTDLSDAGVNEFWLNGTDTDYCPCIDFATCFTRKPSIAGSFAVSVFLRATVVFRDPKGPLADDSRVLELTREDVIDLSNAMKMKDGEQVHPSVTADP